MRTLSNIERGAKGNLSQRSPTSAFNTMGKNPIEGNFNCGNSTLHNLSLGNLSLGNHFFVIFHLMLLCFIFFLPIQVCFYQGHSNFAHLYPCSPHYVAIPLYLQTLRILLLLCRFTFFLQIKYLNSEKITAGTLYFSIVQLLRGGRYQ